MRTTSLVPLLLVLALLVTPSVTAANSGDFSGGVAIGTGYAGVDPAPTNGLLVQGNVGVGTTTTNYNLDVQNSTALPQIHISGTGADSGLYFEAFSADVGNLMAGMSLTNTGYIAKATTANQINFNGGYTYFGNYSGLTVGNPITDAPIVTITTAGLSVGSAYYNTLSATNGAIIQGDVGIGTSSPSYLLQVGSSAASGIVMELQNSSGACTHNPGASSETISCSSDETLKTDIEDTTGGLKWLDDMHIRDFTVRSTRERRTGVVAQELAQTHPDMVHENEYGLYSVEQPNPWVLVKAIQDLHSMVSTQQDEIGELKHTITQLKQQQQAHDDAK
jgi:hypothetical protein